MSRVQIIFAGDQPEAPLSWAIAEEDRVLSSGAAPSLAAFAADDLMPGISSVIVVLPGERFVARHVTTPAKNRQQLLQSARFLLEDDIAGSTDELFLALADEESGEQKTIIAVEKTYVTNWLAALSSFDIKTDILTTDFLCLDFADSSATVLIDNDRLLFNARGSGFAVEQPFGRELVKDLLTQLELTDLTLLLGSGAVDLAVSGVETRRYRIEDPADFIRLHVVNIFRNPPPNLLQGELEPGIDWQAMLKPWRQAAALLAASVVLYLGMVTADAIKLNSAATRISENASAEFSAAYPDVTVRNLRRQARQIAGATDGARSQFLDLATVLTGALEKSKSIELSLLSYDRTGALVADVRFATIDDLDALKQSLTAQGISVEEGRTLTPVGNAYSGKLTLRTGS